MVLQLVLSTLFVVVETSRQKNIPNTEYVIHALCLYIHWCAVTITLATGTCLEALYMSGAVSPDNVIVII